tara:strand:- start:1044 stop:2561 length:1518 start_codon:yes stop_codon:yes gene_type:complete
MSLPLAEHIRTTESLLLFFEEVEPESELLTEGPIAYTLAQLGVVGGMGAGGTWNPVEAAALALAWTTRAATGLLGDLLKSAASGAYKGFGVEEDIDKVEKYLDKKQKEIENWSKKKKEEWGTPEEGEWRRATPEEIACDGKGDLASSGKNACAHGQKINSATCKCEASGMAGYWHAFKRWFTDFANNISTLIQQLYANAKQMVSVIGAAITTGAAASWDWLKQNAPKVWEWAKEVGKDAANLAKQGLEALEKGLVTLWGWIKETYEAVAGWFSEDDAEARPEKAARPAAAAADTQPKGECAPGYVKASELDRLWHMRADTAGSGPQDVPGSDQPIVHHLKKDKCIKCDHADVISKVRLLIGAARRAEKSGEEEFFSKYLNPQERISQDDLICLGSLWNSGFKLKDVAERIFTLMAKELPIDAYSKSGVAATIRANSQGSESLVGDIFKNAPWWKFSNLHPSWREWLKESKNKKTDKIIYESRKLPAIRKRYEIINELTMKKLAGV